MASSLARNRMKRLESKKSHSWWWDSHISPKNSRWLSENLEEMDQKVKSMLKLIEEDGDSFAKKAEMYYQKRPELISRVEDFYRLYRSLAERYDHVTGELKKNVSTDLQSQLSGTSDIGSEPDVIRLPRRKLGPRAAGFEYFLGSAGGSNHDKDGYESSSPTESDTESDVSSVNNYSGSIGNGSEQMVNRKVIELEIELRDVKEKLRMQQEENPEHSEARNVDLRNANAKIQHSEEEIARLKIELKKYKSAGGAADHDWQGELESNHDGLESEELRIAKERLQHAEEETINLKRELEKYISSEKNCSLLEQLESAKKETATWKAKVNTEKKELQEKIMKLKTSLLDKDQEIKDLKIAVSNAKENFYAIKNKISGLIEERKRFEENLNEWESRGRGLEEEIRKVKAEKTEMEQSMNQSIEALTLEKDELNEKVVSLMGELSSKSVCVEEMDKHLRDLHIEHAELIAGAEGARKVIEKLKARSKEVEEEVERQKVLVLEGAEEKREAIRQLCFSLEHYRNGYNRLRLAFQGHRRLPAVLAS